MVEASTSICRNAGYLIGNPAGGLILQSSLGLLSRILVFMFLPIVGAVSDSGNIVSEYYEIALCYMMMPLGLYVLYLNKKHILFLYELLIERVSVNGSLFKSVFDSNVSKRVQKKRSFFKKFKRLYLISFLAYVPYYVSWPIIILLLGVFNENRGLILGLSSVLTGINTLVLTTIVDPKLIQIGRCRKVISIVYNDLIKIRIYSSLLGFFVVLIFCGYFYV
jgi:hypothetical protein